MRKSKETNNIKKQINERYTILADISKRVIKASDGKRIKVTIE